MPRKRGNPGLKGQLLEKSIEAYIMALETINRLSIKYRVEAFAYLICNAWELLLKAKIIEDSNDRRSIFYSMTEKPRPRSLALRDCLGKVFTNDKDPVRANVERAADLRDAAAHLIISQVPVGVLGLLQACVLNYHKFLGVWFSISLSDRVPVGMMTLVYDFQPEQFTLENVQLRRKLGRESVAYLAGFEAGLRAEHESLGRTTDYSINLTYHLALVEKPRDADIVLMKGATGTATRIVEVPKDPSRTHPYRQKELLDALNEALQGRATVNQYDIQCIIRQHGIRKRPEFYYKGTVLGSPGQYSEAFLDWLKTRVEHDPEFFKKARQSFRDAGLATKGKKPTRS